MVNLLCAFTIFGLVAEISSLSCLDVKKGYEKTCMESEQDNYVQCVKTRMKRHSSDCEYSDKCYDCDCDSCSYSQCEGQCSECCNSCCNNYVQCHTNHCCHRQCHSECRNYNCRSSCRRACYDTIERNKEPTRERIIERVIHQGQDGGSSANQQSQVNNTNVHNITTIINLKNVLNNTNFLDVPINLTYTNKNNITLHEAQQIGGSGGIRDSCCIVIGPRQCVPTQVSPYSRCFHTRSRQCGSYCSATIVHEEPTQVCTSVNSLGQPTNCQQKTSYIPQPQPRCTYTSSWPYVSCGIQPSAACQGCYGHYFSSEVKQFKTCAPQCYDDFSVGPLYRQGPFYQPGYAHVSPCAYSPQGCGGGFGGMGGYGFGGGMGMGGMGIMPGFGGYGPMTGGYGYGQGYGGGFAYGGPFLPDSSGLPNQPDGLWSSTNWGNTLNMTGFNVTSSNGTGLFWNPKIPNEFYTNPEPFGQFSAKEMEINVGQGGQHFPSRRHLRRINNVPKE